MSTTWCRCFVGIVERELLRFLRQRSRFFASLVRPLVWLVLFAGGLHSVLGFSRIPPYQTDILYEEYIVPGLVGLILLFNGMQAALSMCCQTRCDGSKLSPQALLGIFSNIVRQIAGVVARFAPPGHSS